MLANLGPVRFCRVNAINVGWTLTDNEHMLQRVEMNSDDWIVEGDKVRRGHFEFNLMGRVNV